MIKLLSSCFPFLLGFSLFFLVSCDDDPTDLGIDLIPDSDEFLITTYDSFTFKSWTDTANFGVIRTYPLYYRNNYDQPIQNSGGYYMADSFNIVGDYKDNVFGRTTSAFIFKMSYLPSVNEPKKDSLRSLYLTLLFQAHVDTVLNLDFKLYALNKKLADTLTYSNFNYQEYLKPIAYDTTLFTKDSIQFKISDDNFLSYLYKDTAVGTDKDATFNANVFGFCITAQPKPGTNGAAVKIKSLKSRCEILYISNKLDVRLKLPLISVSPFTYHFSAIKHDISGTMFESELNKPKSEQQSMFILGGGGSTGRLNIDTSSVRIWRDSLNFTFDKTNTDSLHIAINKVELTLKPEKLEKISSSIYPEYLALVGISDTTRYYLEDYSLGNLRGKYYPEEDVYKFNITKYFLEYLKGNRFIPNFEIRIPRAESSYSRVVFRNNNYKLKITYSKIQ